MSSYVTSDCHRVCPSSHGNRFDTAHRKKAVANIFENVNQDALMRLFQKTGDMKAEERVRSIFSYAQDPEETAKALMALKQRKKDKFLRIAGMVRNLLKLRWLFYIDSWRVVLTQQMSLSACWHLAKRMFKTRWQTTRRWAKGSWLNVNRNLPGLRRCHPLMQHAWKDA